MQHILIPAQTSAGIRFTAGPPPVDASKRARRSEVEREAPGKGRYGDLTAINGRHVAVATNCVS